MRIVGRRALSPHCRVQSAERLATRVRLGFLYIGERVLWTACTVLCRSLLCTCVRVCRWTLNTLRSIRRRLTPEPMYYSPGIEPRVSRAPDVYNNDGCLTEDESENDVRRDTRRTFRIITEEDERKTVSVDGDTAVPRCCICLGRIGPRVIPHVFPCSHNTDVHVGCAWDWVCCHSQTDTDTGTFRIVCPVCRSTKTTRLVSYRDA